MSNPAAYWWNRGVRYWRYQEQGAIGYGIDGTVICETVPSMSIPARLVTTPTYVVDDLEDFDRRVWSNAHDPSAFVKAFAEFFRKQPELLGDFENRCIENALSSDDKAKEVLLLMYGVRTWQRDARKNERVLRFRTKMICV